MAKDFDNWNIEKKKIETLTKDSLIFHEREIWWCSIGVNIGDEQDGKNEFYERPVLVLKKFNSKIAWVLPMTSKDKKAGRYYYPLLFEDKIFTVLLSQLRLVSAKRFKRLIRKISQHQESCIHAALIDLIGR